MCSEERPIKRLARISPATKEALQSEAPRQVPWSKGRTRMLLNKESLSIPLRPSLKIENYSFKMEEF